MGRISRIIIAVMFIVILGVAGLAGAYFAGFIGQPSAGIADIGDWGSVSADRTEIITTLWVRNPNPIGVTIGQGVDATYELSLNGVKLAQGKKQQISIQPGNQTISLTTGLRNQQLPAWWVAYVKNDETIPVKAATTIQITGPVSTGIQLPSYQTTLQQDTTPVITALSTTAQKFQGEYTAPNSGALPVTPTYEVRQGQANWGKVTTDQTTVIFRFTIHNPNRYPIPAAPDGIGVSVDMNNIRLFRAQTEALSLRNIDGDTVIPPGETKEVVLAVTMDNEKIDDWFRSHVKNGEQTTIEVQLQLVFRVQDVQVRLPKEGGITYTCDMQTAILADNQETTTTCGEI